MPYSLKTHVVEAWLLIWCGDWNFEMMRNQFEKCDDQGVRTGRGMWVKLLFMISVCYVVTLNNKLDSEEVGYFSASLSRYLSQVAGVMPIAMDS